MKRCAASEKGGICQFGVEFFVLPPHKESEGGKHGDRSWGKGEGGEGTERVVGGREGEILFCNPQYLPLPTLQTALMCKNCQGWRRNRMEGMDDGAMETRFNNRFAEIQQSILLIE